MSSFLSDSSWLCVRFTSSWRTKIYSFLRGILGLWHGYIISDITLSPATLYLVSTVFDVHAVLQESIFKVGRFQFLKNRNSDSLAILAHFGGIGTGIGIKGIKIPNSSFHKQAEGIAIYDSWFWGIDPPLIGISLSISRVPTSCHVRSLPSFIHVEQYGYVTSYAPRTSKGKSLMGSSGKFNCQSCLALLYKVG